MLVITATYSILLGTAAKVTIALSTAGVPIGTLLGATRTDDIQDEGRFRTGVWRILVESEGVSGGLGKDQRKHSERSKHSHYCTAL